MARILSISSQVLRGHVGNSAAVPALQRLGHEVWPLPTVVLSNHPGHPKVAGLRIAPETMLAMVRALAENGWLGEVDAVATGYLPSVAHVEAASEAITLVSKARRGHVTVLIDPVLGDDPKGLYVDEAAARALSHILAPRADIITPNRFELAWMTGESVTSAASAHKAIEMLGIETILATSIPGESGDLLNLLHTDRGVTEIAVPKLATAPHGTGDLLAALFLGHLLNGDSAPAALHAAVAEVQAAIAASVGGGELCLLAAAPVGRGG